MTGLQILCEKEDEVGAGRKKIEEDVVRCVFGSEVSDDQGSTSSCESLVDAGLDTNDTQRRREYDAVKEDTREDESHLFVEINRKFNVLIVRESDGALLLAPFVQAVDQFLGVFDALGAAFSEIVKGDMRQNLHKITCAAKKYKVESMQDMIELEVKDGIETQSSSGTEALLWLKRTLQFILRLIFRIVQCSGESLSLSETAVDAYDTSLRACHNWIFQQMFHAALLCLPTREQFFYSLGPCEQSVRAEMTRFVHIFGPILRVAEEHYLASDLEQWCVIRMADACSQKA